MKFIIYYLLKTYVRLGFFFFYREVKVYGAQKLPEKTPVMILPNHQNAFLDAMLTGGYNPGRTHFMTRADIFRNPFWRKVMLQINMHPIYRIRDGKESLGRNEEIFKKCHNILSKGHHIMIHPEGNHDHKYRIRHVSKGFTRIVFGAIEKYPDMDLKLVPLGINYSDHHKYRSRVSLYFDDPIDAQEYIRRENGAMDLKKTVEKRLQQLTVHIPETVDYYRVKSNLTAAGADLTDPAETNKLVKELIQGEKSPAQKKKNSGVSFFEKLVYPLVYMNNIIFILLWKLLKTKIKDPGFQISIKFALGLFLLPWIYFLQTWVVYALTHNPITAFCYLFLSVFSVSILSIRQGSGFSRPH